MYVEVSIHWLVTEILENAQKAPENKGSDDYNKSFWTKDWKIFWMTCPQPKVS